MELNMNDIMEQAKKMQEKMQEIQDSLINLKVVGEAGNGMVRLVLNGRHEVVKAVVSLELLGKADAESKQRIETYILEAVNNASAQIESASQEHLKGLASSLNLPQDPHNGETQG